ncbi:hypothetical protein ACQY0O_005241 [Thecaphora frezii]
MLRRTLALFNQASASFSSPSASSSNLKALTSLTSHLASPSLPPVVARQKVAHKNLYEHLSTLPNDGVGFRVRQRKWMGKGLDVPRDVDLREQWRNAQRNAAATEGGVEKKMPIGPQKEEGHLCYWEVTRVKLKDGGRHGKAWGRLVWRGKSSEAMLLREMSGFVTTAMMRRGADVPILLTFEPGGYGCYGGNQTGKQVTPPGKDERIRGALKYIWDAAR